MMSALFDAPRTEPSLAYLLGAILWIASGLSIAISAFLGLKVGFNILKRVEGF
jgi:hypothetical protein